MTQKTRSLMLNLPTQAILLLVLLVIMISSAVGIPAIWLLHDQLEQQAWKQASQGSQMLSVLLESRQNELQNLAILTAQRPTLAALTSNGDPEPLQTYLETLRTGANLDTVLVCDNHGQPLVYAGLDAPPNTCELVQTDDPTQLQQSLSESGWLVSYQQIATTPSTIVVVAQAVDTVYVSQLAKQTGMEVVFLSNKQVLSSSIEITNTPNQFDSSTLVSSVPNQSDSPGRMITLDGGESYYSVLSNTLYTKLETVVLLPAARIIQAQKQMTRIGMAGILSVTLTGAVIAVFLTRRISYPLKRLQESALKLRKGDLETPVTASTKVREIAEVAYSLEDARVSLRHTLDQLRQEKAWGDYLLESVVEGIITLDRRGRITFFSQGAERITGWKQEQVLSSGVDEVFLPADRERRFSDCIPEPGSRHQIITILVDNKPITIAVSGAHLAPPEAGVASLALSIRDISNEEAMRGLLGEFLANITHEFRTPLTALAASIELLLDQLPDLSHEEIQDLLQSNHIGVLSLQNLIDNLLEGASIEAGRFKVTPHPTDLAEVIRSAAGTLQPLIDKNQQLLQLDLPSELPLVQADPRRTSQVLVNLLSNALKWGPQASTISVAAESFRTEVKVTVTDEGPGILPEEKQNLFIRFGHIQSNSGRAEYGAGLGLSVVKAIVESQAGQVGAEDRAGGGAAFWFTIPVTAIQTDDEEPSE